MADDEAVRRVGANWGMIPDAAKGAPARHCGGCSGFGPGWDGDCTGISPDHFRLSDFRYAIPSRLPWAMRWKILFGRPVATAPESAVVESGTIPGASAGELIWREYPPS